MEQVTAYLAELQKAFAATYTQQAAAAYSALQASNSPAAKPVLEFLANERVQGYYAFILRVLAQNWMTIALLLTLNIVMPILTKIFKPETPAAPAAIPAAPTASKKAGKKSN